MKTFTNYAQGTRGIRTKTGMVWLDPGQSEKIDTDDIVGEVPDLGKKADAEREDGPDAGEFNALQQKVADLTKQVETLTGENKALTKDKADLTKQVETLTKPAK